MKIKYFYSNNNIPDSLRLSFEKTIPNEDTGYHRCYAHKWANLNRFTIRCPFDLNFTLDPIEGQNEYRITFQDVYTSNLFKDGLIQVTFSDAVVRHKPVFQLPLNVVFYTKKTCFLETGCSNNFKHNLKFINGKFDISSWVRPLNVAFEIQSYTQPVQIKRNEIIGELIFHTSKINENIILEENKKPSSQLLNLSEGNSRVSGYIKNTKALISKGKKLLQEII